MRGKAVGACFGLLLAGAAAGVGAQRGNDTEWLYHSGDLASTKYSPLDQIDRESVADLRIVWRRPAVSPLLREQAPDMTFGKSYRTTPLLIDETLYAPDAIGLIEAFDPATGETVWIQELPEEGDRTFTGSDARSLAYWDGGDTERLFVVKNSHLMALDLATGRLVRSFGDGGRIDLRLGPERERIDAISSPTPLVVGDVLIVGSSLSDAPPNKEANRGDVRAFDARSGAPLWTFRVIPGEGEPGVETWEDGSWAYTGHANLWTLISADEELGYAYFALSSPTNDMYGGHRLGANLFSDSVVAVDIETGEEIWHFQTVHHDLWDYDLPAAPILVDIRVDGREIRALVQVTKQAFAFVLDRVTGEPVWPIEERPVPGSKTPGERTAPTQPFPTRPRPFDRQGVTEEDLIDFTPELRAEALEILRGFVTGPLFTPPSIREDEPDGTRGTLQLPGSVGGADWGGGAFDPETGILYVPSVTGTFTADLLPGNPDSTNLRYVPGTRAFIEGPRGLPLFKPPYGRITAIDLNTGEHVWMVPNGDGPRDHPAIAHLNLPPLGQPGRTHPLVTKTLLFVAEGGRVQGRTPPGGGGRMFRAYDKATGDMIWEMELPAGTTGAPMTYMYEGRQYILVAVGASDHDPEFVALSIP